MLNIPPIIWQLFGLYIIIIITLTLRIHVEATGYTSPDSHFYLRATENYLNDKGFVIPSEYPFNDDSPESFMAIWTVGYPSYIVLICKLTGLSAFWASKITNFVFLAFIFILLHRWYGINSLFPALYFCSFGKLEIYSYTWSEGVFLFFLLWFLFLLEKILKDDISSFRYILLIFSLISLVWIRYAGLIYFFYSTIIFLILVKQQKYQYAKYLFVTLLISSSLVMIYLSYNYYHTGGFFGGQPRIFPETESWINYLALFIKGFLNELFIIRYFYGKLDILFFILLFIQLSVIYFIFSTCTIDYAGLAKNKLLISSGLFYLIFLFILRKLSPFDAFDYRVLAPFSTPIYIAVLAHLQTIIRYKKLKITLISFFILSLLMNLPKKAILQWIVSQTIS